MNTVLLNYLVAYATHGSSKQAAISLGVDRSSITRGIKRLEDEFETKLFLTTADEVVPTLAGETCLKYAREILRINHNLYFDLAADGQCKCTIDIGMNISRSQRMLPEILPAFHQQYPNIQVRLHELSQSKEYELALVDRLLDFAILRYPIHSPQLVFEELMTEDYVFVAPEGDPFAAQHSYQSNGNSYIMLEYFQDKSFILCTRAQKSRMICDSIFKKAGFIPHIALQTHSHLNAALLAWNGFAYTLVPQSYTIVNSKEDIKYYLLDPKVDIKGKIGIVTPKGSLLSHAAQQLKMEFINHYRENNLSVL